MKNITSITAFVLLLIILTAYKFQAPSKTEPEPVSQKQAGKKPNIIFILMDDLGYADIGVNGSSFYETPHINQLASQGIRFAHAYAAAPVCSPTRAALLTGKHPARLQLTDWLPGRKDMPSQKLLRAALQPHLPLAELTLAEVLKQNGYATAAIGKWHLGDESYGPEAQGFDLNIAGDESGTPASYFYPYANAGLKTWTIPGLEEGQTGEYLTDRLTTEAEKFIQQNKNKPFFLYLPHFAVHIPLKAKEALIQKYQKKAKTDGEQDNAIYAAMIESMDQSVGRIMQKLDELKLTQNTIVVFTSDNGGLHVKEGPNTPATSNAPYRAGKGYLYEGGIRVPLIVRWPGVIKAGSSSSVPVSTVDFFPTFLEATRSKAAPGLTLDGVSLLPVLKGAAGLPRHELYWHYPHYSNQGGKPGAAVRQREFKLIEFYEYGQLELYNLQLDKGEKNNLATQHPEITRQLKAKLDAWRLEVNAQLPKPNPEFSGQIKD